MSDNYPKTAQGQAILATAEDIARDEAGITDPNLHRRIDNETTPLHEGEILPDQYVVSVSGVNSYRTTKHTVHSEEDDLNEIP